MLVHTHNDHINSVNYFFFLKHFLESKEKRKAFSSLTYLLRDNQLTDAYPPNLFPFLDLITVKVGPFPLQK